jgi:CBS domain containing-hemolysin-like protein
VSALLLQAACLVCLIALSAFFSGSEAAVFSLPQLRIRRLVSEKARFSGILSRLLLRPERTLISMLLGNTVANVGASLFAALISFRLSAALGIGRLLGTIVGIAGMTVLLVVLGEITPKWYSLERAERVSLRVAPLLFFFTVLFLPLSYFLDMVARGAGRGRDRRALVTMEEIWTMLEAGKETKSLKVFEQEIIKNVFEFSGTAVREIMTPRSEMFSLARDVTVGEARSLLNRERHSRIPVYDEDLDDIAGVLYVKDILSARMPDSSPVMNLLKPAYFVPETMGIGGLLEEFQRRRVHFAIVVDEHGGTKGLVTLDDILKEIVGDIAEDKRPGEVPDVVIAGDKELLVDGYIGLGDLKERFGLEVPLDEFDTLSGFIYGLAGKVPVEGQSFDYRGARYRVEEVQGSRITRVRITRTG